MKIVVLCGGTSPEREVSLNSGAAVEKGLQEAGFETALEDVRSIPELIKKWPDFRADGAFIALHGGWGEDGRIQAALEKYGIPFTGTCAAGCRAAMDKETSRDVMRRNGIPIPSGTAFSYDEKWHAEDLLEKWGRIVIKPASGGSTVGVSITDDPADANEAIAAVWDIDIKAVVEQYIAGRELTVTVFGDGEDAFAMPVTEIRPNSGFYDYASKYTKGASEYVCPAELAPETATRVADYAKRAHNALSCSIYSRTDFRLSEEGGIYALETNTAPGMTATSLVPKAAAAQGWSFPELLRRIVGLSFGAERGPL